MKEIEKIKGRYEYPSSVKLKGLESKHISIPSTIIMDTDMDEKRIAVFSYFRIIKGLDDSIGFSVSSLVRWCGLKPDTRSNGVSQKFIDIITSLSDRGYLTYYEKLSKTAHIDGYFNYDKVFDECFNEGFAILYLDEIEKIMKYNKDENNKDTKFNNAILLLVFAYFRNMIFNRPNKLRPEEYNYQNKQDHVLDIEARRERSPEAYADNYKTIGENLGISERLVSKSVDILEDLGLITTDRAFRVRNEDGEFRTQYTIFANAYKREKEELLASGESYSRPEIERKAKIIQKYNKSFIIDKEKRRNVKGA